MSLKFYEVPRNHSKELQKNISKFLEENKTWSKNYALNYLLFNEKGEIVEVSDNLSYFYMIRRDDQLIIGNNTLENINIIKKSDKVEIFCSETIFNKRLDDIMKEKKDTKVCVLKNKSLEKDNKQNH